ncbi:MAG TPA: thioredoxin domain-containing protein [Gemmatimonadota bacterium]|nr:thioredoxin domain-containing protein [Gemmatimonadota bacterium]
MTTTFDPTNRLADASSPYLLQHADNPVAWREWEEKAFEEARRLDRPLFLSIGYSTCHWCHVMAHESFEDEEVAGFINEHFVPVKVDREERPDVDDFYMTACQAMSGQGGWPLTVFATPEGEPFFAGTYFPPEARGRRPGFLQLLRGVAGAWEERREDVLSGAARAVDVLGRVSGGEPGDLLDEEVMEAALAHFEARFDETHGGFGGAPKFPSPHVLLFLLRHAERTGHAPARDMVVRTLNAMRRGGIFDQVGFGFHRYSTDARWLVPHFEKMLYDQALLALAYLEGARAAGERRFEEVAREVLTYVSRDLADPEGGFHAAEDADSEGGEGAFYTWTLEELDDALGAEDADLARRVYGAQRRGNYAEEAGGGFTGRNILHLPRPLGELADELGMDPAALRERVEGIRARLLEARDERPRPHRDDKVLTDWNGLAIAALARAGAVLGEERWTERARRAAGFVLSELRDADGRLLHRWRRGEAGVPATSEDYAYLVWGLIELYEATLEPRWLSEALRLETEMADRCWDPEGGGYFLAGADAADLPVRRKEAYDGALPSGNAVAAWNGLRLARLTGDAGREERALAVERAFAGGARNNPGAHTALLVVADFRLGTGSEVVVAGERGEASTGRLLEVVREGYRPRTVLLLRPPGEEGEEMARLAPFTAGMGPDEGRARAYVCRDFACEAPVAEPDALRAALDEGG